MTNKENIKLKLLKLYNIKEQLLKIPRVNIKQTFNRFTYLSSIEESIKYYEKLSKLNVLK